MTTAGTSRTEYDPQSFAFLSEVRKALAEIGYSGAATTELEGGDEAYLRDVSKRVDRLVLGVSS